MDFFDREARAQKQTRRLIWLFGLAVVAVLLINNLILATLVAAITHPVLDHSPRWHPISIFATALYLFGEAITSPGHFFRIILHPQTFCIITFANLLSILVGCWYKTRQLSGGGSVVAEFLGGRCIEPDTKDLDEQRLRNVIEEMAIASGTSVPEIYLLDNERGVNAFAAGHTRDDIVIGVTRGCLKLLTRDELQGVIAHEFNHILNGDTRLNMRLIGLAHGLFWPTLAGRVLLYGTTDPSLVDSALTTPNGKPKVLPTTPLGVLLIILGSTNLPFVRLIKSAICRQREWEADAAAVQFTRNPTGIAGALKKIGGLYQRGRLNTPHAEVASHLYFANSSYEPWFGFLATHPPLRKRITAIDPAFDGQFPSVKMLAPNQYERDQAFEQALVNSMETTRTRPESSVNFGSEVTGLHLRAVSLLRLNFPPEVKAALRQPAGAAGIVFSLLLSDDDTVCATQSDILRRNLPPDLLAATSALAQPVAELGDRYKLTLAEFAVPALRQNTPEDNELILRTMRQLIECEGSVDLFEYALMKMITRQLQSYFNGPDLDSARPGRVQDLLPECAVLLSALAHVGQKNETDARVAFADGAAFLNSSTLKPQFLARNQWDLSKVDTALTRLSSYRDPLKRNVLLACGRTVVSNGKVNEREAELLRAIADSFGCPVPPFVEAIRSEELASTPSS